MSRDLRRTASMLLAASLVPPPLPAPPASMFEKSKPSGKDRSKVKASRKQRREGK